MPEKTCARCKKQKPAENFIFRGKFQKRLCRECLERDENSVEQKQCTSCKKHLAISQFHLSNGQRAPYCKTCVKQQTERVFSKRALTVRPIPEMKKCSKCGELKSGQSFYNSNSTTDGRSTYCKECSIKAAKESGARLVFEVGLLKIPKKKVSAWMREFRLDYDQILALLHKSQASCEICGKLFSEVREIHLDHDHSKGTVRGVLCLNCNLMLGHAKDNPAILSKAVLYLTERPKHLG